jgi:hypothetical protein
MPSSADWTDAPHAVEHSSEHLYISGAAFISTPLARLRSIIMAGGTALLDRSRQFQLAYVVLSFGDYGQLRTRRVTTHNVMIAVATQIGTLREMPGFYFTPGRLTYVLIRVSRPEVSRPPPLNMGRKLLSRAQTCQCRVYMWSWSVRFCDGYRTRAGFWTLGGLGKIWAEA